MDYKKRKNFLLCLDSDGCVMNVMDIKHKECFAPCLFNYFELKENALDTWIEINLHSPDRGINRFKGLHLLFMKLNERGEFKEDFSDLSEWIKNTNEFSERSLENRIKNKKSIFLNKVLAWSKEVNVKISELKKEELLPYRNAVSAIKKAHEVCDIAVVSSANFAALKNEWSRHGLLEYTSICMSQDFGTKSDCISLLLKEGYEKDKVLMVGDAIGDLNAAAENKVGFYPITACKEEESWERFIDILDSFLSGTYKNAEENFKREFIRELGGN